MAYTTRHFVTGNFTSHAKFVDNATYATLLDNVVKATCDIFVRRRSDGWILLGKRLGEPQPDWWLPGGRMLPGESTAHSVQRILKREIGIDILPSPVSSKGFQQLGSSNSVVSEENARQGRTTNSEAVGGSDGMNTLSNKPSHLPLWTVGHYTFVWGSRAQPPTDHGTCDVSLIVCAIIPDDVAASVVRVPSEYSCLAWCDPVRLCRKGALITLSLVLKTATILVWRRSNPSASVCLRHSTLEDSRMAPMLCS